MPDFIKKDKIVSQCQGILKEKPVSIRELRQVLGRLSSTAMAVLAAPLQYRAIQKQQTAELANTKNFFLIVLTEEARKELQRLLENLQLTKGKTLINSQPQLTISTHPSVEGGRGGSLLRSKDISG